MPTACFKHVNTRGKGLGTLQEAYKHLFGTRDHEAGEDATSGISKDIYFCIYIYIFKSFEGKQQCIHINQELMFTGLLHYTPLLFILSPDP